MLLVNKKTLDLVIDRALEEDLGETGDITSQLIFAPDEFTTGCFLAKAHGVLAGGPLIERVLKRVDADCRVTRLLEDGCQLLPGRIFAAVEGRTASLLAAERTILNFIQRLSGIATLTRRFLEKIKNFPACRVTDTRKTTPGLRVLEKYAVRVGGGGNHRFGLFDAVMIKDNHIQAAGSIGRALGLVRNRLGHTVKIEVEVESRQAALEAVEHGADIVMLDNMSPDVMKSIVSELKGRAIFEASGGISLDTIGNAVKSGVDCISVGALTHSAPALDISFELNRKDTA